MHIKDEQRLRYGVYKLDVNAAQEIILGIRDLAEDLRGTSLPPACAPLTPGDKLWDNLRYLEEIAANIETQFEKGGPQMGNKAYCEMCGTPLADPSQWRCPTCISRASKISDKQAATILAALRYWQAAIDNGEINLVNDADPHVGIATNGGEMVPLDSPEIDDLCGNLNRQAYGPLP